MSTWFPAVITIVGLIVFLIALPWLVVGTRWLLHWYEFYAEGIIVRRSPR